MSDIDVFLAAVKAEYLKTLVKYPGNDNQNIALMEEVGELSQAMLDLHGGGYQRPTEAAQSCEIFNEAVQVASVSARIAIQGDSWCPKYNFKHALKMSKEGLI